MSGNLVLQGTPEIPATLKQRLRQYLNTRRASLADLTPDGKSLLITTSQVHLVKAPLGARAQLTFNDEPVRSARFVPGGSRAVTYLGDIGGNEAYQIFRLDLASGHTTLLTDGKSRHGAFAWSRDGKSLAYTSNARNGKDMDLYLGDGQDPSAAKLLLERKGHWMPMDWSPDGARLLIMNYRSINDSRLFMLDIKSRAVTRVSPEKPAALYRDALFDSSGRYIFTATDREGEFGELYRVDLAAGEGPPRNKQRGEAGEAPRGQGAKRAHTGCTQPRSNTASGDGSTAAAAEYCSAGPKWKPLTRTIKWNVERLALSSDGGTLAFTTNQGGVSELHLLDTNRLTHRAVKGVPRGVISGLRFARGANTLGLSITGATTPGDAYTYDLRHKRLKRWTASEVGGLNPERFVEPALIRFKTFDGRKIPAFYYRPAGDGPHPVLVWIHGGPESQSRPTFRAVLQYLVVESGVAVLVPNVRGSDGYGKSYLLLDNGFKREDSVKDIGALLDWVKGRKELDADRLGVLGGSYGGYMVLASLVHYAHRITAGVDVVGISNFVTFLTNTKAYRRDLRRAEYGNELEPKMNAFLQRISPSNHADKIRSALFLAHGANDPRVPLSETDQLVEAVKKGGKETWYMVARNEGHGFRKKENRDTFWLLTILFFEKHLGIK